MKVTVSKMCLRGDKIKQIYIIHTIIIFILYMTLMPVNDNITRVTFSFWTTNMLGKMHLATRKGGGGEFLEYYALYRNISHYQPLRIFIN